MPSSTKTCPTIDVFLQQPKGHLETMVAKVKRLIRLNQYLKAVLEQPLSNHCKIANIKNDQLILAIDTPAWASRIRYMAPDLLKALQKKNELKNIKNIQCMVSPENIEHNTGKKEHSAKTGLSLKTTELLKSTAQSIQDKELKNALLKLVDYSLTAKGRK